MSHDRNACPLCAPKLGAGDEKGLPRAEREELSVVDASPHRRDGALTPLEAATLPVRVAMHDAMGALHGYMKLLDSNCPTCGHLYIYHPEFGSRRVDPTCIGCRCVGFGKPLPLSWFSRFRAAITRAIVGEATR